MSGPQVKPGTILNVGGEGYLVRHVEDGGLDLEGRQSSSPTRGADPIRTLAEKARAAEERAENLQTELRGVRARRLLDEAVESGIVSAEERAELEYAARHDPLRVRGELDERERAQTAGRLGIPVEAVV